jgi:para-nitrobenzyl esterase
MPAAQKGLAKVMAQYWTSFARNGVPTAVGAPVWEPFRSDDRVLRFEPDRVSYSDAGTQHNCGFWAELYPSILAKKADK